MKESKAIIAINESTKEVKKFRSINEAARELNSTFCAIKGAFFRGGSVKGWKIYGSPDMIQSRIDELKKELALVNNLLGENGIPKDQNLITSSEDVVLIPQEKQAKLSLVEIKQLGLEKWRKEEERFLQDKEIVESSPIVDNFITSF